MQCVNGFMSFDGKFFYDKDECQAYENEKQKIRILMFDREGKLTDDSDNAFLVYVSTKYIYEMEDEEIEAEMKCFADKFNDNSFLSINDGGWWYWNEWSNSYTWIDSDILAMIHRVILKGVDVESWESMSAMAEREGMGI